MKTRSSLLRLLLLTLLTSALIYCSTERERKVAQSSNTAVLSLKTTPHQVDLTLLPDYLLGLRNLYARTDMKTLQKLNIVESSVLEALFNPDKRFNLLRKKFRDLNNADLLNSRSGPSFIKEILGLLKLTVTSQGNVHLKPLRLIHPNSKVSGYSNLQLLVNHSYGKNQEIKQASDLAQGWINFIQGAKQELMINVFDFDHMEIATAISLLNTPPKNINVTVGIDRQVIKDRPEVAKVVQLLKDHHVNVIAVNSVGLNHQKIALRDWSVPENAAVLFSSGNLTYSCLDPVGDFHAHREHNTAIPEEALPNANHLITMNSWLAAQITHHELSKTFDLKMRGRTLYPLNGSYQILERNANSNTLEPFPAGSFLLTFTPNGATVVKDKTEGSKKIIAQSSVNKYLLAEIIKRFSDKSNNSKIIFRMAQFAFSAKDINRELYSLVQNLGLQHIDLKIIGDRPFAMAEWSQFLDLSALERIKDENKTVRYQISSDPNHPWRKLCRPVPASLNNSNDIATCTNTKYSDKIQSNIYVAPARYGDHHIIFKGKNLKLTSKIHHKMMSIRDHTDDSESFAVLGTSFNFSEGAEANNEQVLVFQDRNLAIAVEQIVDSLAEGATTVVQEAGNRNQRSANKDPSDEEEEQDPGESESRAVKTPKKKK